MCLRMSAVDRPHNTFVSPLLSVRLSFFILKNEPKSHRCDFGWGFLTLPALFQQEDRGTGAVSRGILLRLCSGGGGQTCPPAAKLPENVCFSSISPVPPPPHPRSVSLFFFFFCLIDFCCTAHRGGSSIHECRSCGGTVKSRRRGGNEGCQGKKIKKRWRGLHGSSLPCLVLCTRLQRSGALVGGLS